MRTIIKLATGAAFAVGLGAAGFAALAQNDPKIGTTIKDPLGPVPDPTHVPVTLPKDIKWNGTEGKSQNAVLYGDPSKPGPYTVIYKWYPGSFSKPHFHDKERWAYVMSGTWWVSTSNVYDERT